MWSRLIAASCAILLLTSQSLADISDRIAALSPSGLILVLDEKGDELVAQNVDQPFSPASVAKIVTAWLAMEVLGGDYQFETSIYMDDDRNLYVRGGGDPFLVSEEWELLAQNLIEATGKEPFETIVVDTSYYPSDLQIPGIKNDNESYNAPNSALAVNFNTIHAVRKGKSVKSAEKQTPITPVAVEQFRTRGPSGRGRISLPKDDPDVAAKYAGEMLAAFISKAGGIVKNGVSVGSVPEKLDTIYIHRQSRKLDELLTLMLLGSNNFLANQIFLEVGAHRLGGPVSLEKSLKVAGELLAKHDLADDILLREGSGISPENQFTARGLAGLLQHFSPHAELLRRNKAGSRYKTGSIDGVRALAGYAATKQHGNVMFVISLGGNTGKKRFQLLRAIERGL